MNRTCDFGSLAENQCAAEAVWVSQLGSAWCDKHKPTWCECVRIAGQQKNEQKILFPGGARPDRRGRAPANPHWSHQHVHQ